MIAKTVSSRRQTSAVTAGLQQWIRSRSGYADAIISGVEKPAGAGLSNETFLFECVTADRHEALVMQVGPAGHGLFRDYDLSVMARALSRLRPQCDGSGAATVGGAFDCTSATD